jgi:hypothetical protein
MNHVHTAPGAPTALARRYADVRARTVRLAAPLSPEDCQVQSMPDASPSSGTWRTPPGSSRPSCWNARAGVPAPFDAGFKVLFNSYYHGWASSTRGPSAAC